MNKIKYGIAASVAVLGFSFANIAPTAYAITDEPVGGAVSQLSGAALTNITLGASSVTTSVRIEKQLSVTYNDGFLTSDINDDYTLTGVELKSGEDVAYVGFVYNYTDEQMEIPEIDYNAIYVYGYQPGAGVYTVKVTDTAGNTATADLAVTVDNALGMGYGSVDMDCGALYCDAAYEVGATFLPSVQGATHLSVKQVPMTSALQALDENLLAVLDISAVDDDENVVPVTNTEINAWMGIHKDVLGVENPYFQIVYIEGGAIAQYYDVENIDDDGWGYLFDVTLSHLSNYGILASATPFESAAARNAKLAKSNVESETTSDESTTTIKAPNTGAMTSAAKSGAENSLAIIATVMVALSCGAAVRLGKRN